MSKIKLYYIDLKLQKHIVELPEHYVCVYTKIGDEEIKLSYNEEEKRIEITSINQLIIKPHASNHISIDVEKF